MQNNNINKYKLINNKTIKELWDNYPEYIVWLDDNIDTISIDQYIVAECREEIGYKNMDNYE